MITRLAFPRALERSQLNISTSWAEGYVMTSISTLCNKSWWCIWSQFKWKPWSAVPGWNHSWVWWWGSVSQRLYIRPPGGHMHHSLTTTIYNLIIHRDSSLIIALITSWKFFKTILITISPLGLVIILRSRRLWSCLICTPLGYGRNLLRWLDSCKVILKSSSLLIIWVDLWKYVKL